jgi:hypothetical protein
MTLPSNSSMNYYPENTLSNYVTKLPQLFDFDGSWEVGLSEVLFPISWPTVKANEIAMRILIWHKNPENNQYVRDEWVTISPPPGHYESPDILVKQINAKIERVEYRKNLARFLYNDISKKITVRFDEKALSETIILMSKPMAELLGFEWETKTRQKRDVKPPTESGGDEPGISRKRRQVEDEIKDYLLVRAGDSDMVALGPEDALSYTASGVCDLQRGFYSLFVYCDIVEPVVVGDVKAPLLRVVNISGKEGSTISRIYQNIQYVPILRKQFDTIEIDIRSDFGQKVAFERGKVIVVLHFRRRKPSYL